MSNSQVIPQSEAKSALKGYTTSKELLHYTLFMPCTHIYATRCISIDPSVVILS